MSNGLTRLATRFLGEPESVEKAQAEAGKTLDAEAAEELGFVTAAFDPIDWDDEVRIFLEERSSSLRRRPHRHGGEPALRGARDHGDQDFGRLTAWQNWISQRPNAAGAEGALKRYGTGVKANFNPERV